MALADQDIEFRRAVPAVIPVVEVNPKPDAPFAVIDVDCAAIERVGMGKKNHDCGWKLNPSMNLREFGEFEKLGCGLVKCFSFTEFNSWTGLHFSEHDWYPPSSFTECMGIWELVWSLLAVLLFPDLAMQRSAVRDSHLS